MNRRFFLIGLLVVFILVLIYPISHKYFSQKSQPQVSPAPIAASAAPVLQDDSEVIDKLDTKVETSACDKNKSPSPIPTATPI